MKVNHPDRHTHHYYDSSTSTSHEHQSPPGRMYFEVHVWPSSDERSAPLSELVALIRSLRDARDVDQNLSVAIIQPDETLRMHAKAVIDVMSVSFEVRYLRHISDMDHTNHPYHHSSKEKVIVIIDQTSIDTRIRELEGSPVS